MNLAGASGEDECALDCTRLASAPGARPEVIRSVAVAAEAARFATLWAGEHVVMVDQPRSRYPYAGATAGSLFRPRRTGWIRCSA